MKKILLIDQIVEDKSINYLEEVKASLTGMSSSDLSLPLEFIHVHLPTQQWRSEYLHDADVILLSGSVCSAYDEFPWKAKATQVLDEVIISGKPALATCFSAQFLAHYLGGKVEKNPNGIEFGPIQIELAARDDGEKSSSPDPRDLLAPFVYDKFLFATHGDCITQLPESCKLLASNTNSTVQAYSYGNILATQFHSEIPTTTARSLLDKRKGLYLEKGLIKDEQDFLSLQSRLEKVAESHRFLIDWLAKSL